ncbi:AfsR/SARP family transcriptional regulator [Paractinoplanes atraurantiacus]|uniref:DNA-binding transcriptional activator of the SARP family n=1 Tax=Paractinoplanes atraurantiacus TaxID=1036182 RepID=A0A285JH06_9ACTN|nr:BTAD domain-containing putative transcriptional regulator [Actinoplanes atraurantiacus]SNY59077.1 DNA-binding transcriptional activator of the SARP family [Actinoplanes atraurantiacus]
MTSAITFSLLGPVRAWRDGVELPLGDARQRTVLAVLLLREGARTSTSELAEAIGDQFQVPAYVHRLRRTLSGGPVQLVWFGGGYALHVPSESVDARRLTTHLARADGAGAEAAAAELEAAVALRRGVPLEGVTGTFAAEQRERLDEMCRTAATRLPAVLLESGRYEEAIAGLRALVAERPLHEPGHALLLTALHRAGRRAEALAHYRTVRYTLATQLGVEPAPELRKLNRMILDVDYPTVSAVQRGLPPT